VRKASGTPQPQIYSDIDGVIAFALESLVIAINVEFGSTFDACQLTTYHDWMSPKMKAFFHTHLQKDELFHTNMPPFMNSIAGLAAIREAGLKVTIMSERKPSLEKETAMWLARWGVEYDELVVGGNGCKAKAAATHGPKNPALFLDDQPKFVYSLPRPGVELWLVKSSYVPTTAGKLAGVTIFNDWAVLLEHLGASPNPPLPVFERTDQPGTAVMPTHS
jgi:hypothetical protein